MLVWYAAYGSNLAAERFRCYVQGGRPAGATRTYPGCRDQTLPRDDRAMVLPGEIFFGWESPTWGGGIAFLDPDDPGDTGALARAYLLTAGQFADVAAQEMHRPPGVDLDLAEVLEHARHELGPGRYETLHLVGELDGNPVLTFTAADPGALTRNPPTAAYLQMMISGLAEAHDLNLEQAATYLASRDGIGSWTATSITALGR